MLNKLKRAIILSFAAIALGLVLAPASAGASCAQPASSQEAIQCGACNAAGTPAANCPTTSAAAGQNINSTLKNAINIASLIAGTVAVIMLIVGGINYASSSGNEQSVAGAKRTILYALIGLVIVAVAQVVVHFVLHNVTTSLP